MADNEIDESWIFSMLNDSDLARKIIKSQKELIELKANLNVLLKFWEIRAKTLKNNKQILNCISELNSLLSGELFKNFDV